MIRAECHSDDMLFTAKFDATPWFAQASDDEILDLAKCNWGCDYPADAVADFFDDKPGYDDVSDMYGYINKTQKRRDPVGFECNIHAVDAVKWIAENRPSLAQSVADHLEDFPLADDSASNEPHWDSDGSWSGEYQKEPSAGPAI